MNVICLEEPAFYALINEVLQRVGEKQEKKRDKWISGEEVMKMLRITSKTTMQKLRDGGEIIFSQNGKMILYDSDSVEEYLTRHKRDKF